MWRIILIVAMAGPAYGQSLELSIAEYVRKSKPTAPPVPSIPAPSSPQPGPAVSEKPVVTLVTDPSWCAPCRQLDTSIEEYGEDRLPFKIERRKPQPGEAVPRFLWGNWQHVGYEPIERFVRRWEYANGAQKPQPQQGKLCQCVAVTGNRQAYCPCLPLGKGCHCSPSRPHRFD